MIISSSGIQIPTIEELISDLEKEERDEIDQAIDTSPQSPLGQLNGIFAAKLREAYEALLACYQAFDPNQSEQVQLNNLCLLTGTKRSSAEKSKFFGSRKVKLGGTIGTVIPIGTQFHPINRPDDRFGTVEEITLTSSTENYVACQALNAGPIYVNAGTLTIIYTPVSGLNSVTNVFDAVPGKLEDNDAELRERRDNELYQGGSCTAESTKSALLAFVKDDGSKPISSVTYYENDTSDPDPITGNAPHSIEFLVYSGAIPNATPDEIAQIIYDNKTAGTEFLGNTTGYAKTRYGQLVPIKFTVPIPIEIQTLIELKINTSQYEGDAKLKQAIQILINSKTLPGRKVLCESIIGLIQTFKGIEEIPTVKLGLAFGVLLPHYQALGCGLREVLFIESNQITINWV